MTADGYRLEETIYSDRNTGHVIDYYFDGFGEVRKMVDQSGLGGAITTTRSMAIVGSRMVTRESLPFLAGDVVRYVETKLDLKGRPENLRRVNATYTLDKQIKSYSYNTDNSV